MTNNRRNALVGLFVLGGLICFGILLVKFGESRFLFLSKVYTIKARFDTISGVREGTEVRLAGVPVGQVLSVELKNSNNPTEGVITQLEIRSKFDIPIGWTAFVETPLMGQPVINILPPTGHIPVVIPPKRLAFLPKDGTGELHGEVENPLEKIISPQFLATVEKTTAQIGTLAEALTPAANAITGLLEYRPISAVENPNKPPDFTANLYTAVERLHNVLKHLDEIIGSPESQKNIGVTLTNLREASETLKSALSGIERFSGQMQVTATQASEFLANANSTVTVTREEVQSLARKLTGNLDLLSRLLGQLVTASENLNTGKGAVPMLLHDPKLYEELMLTIERIGAAAEEMRVLVKQWQAKGILGK